MSCDSLAVDVGSKGLVLSVEQHQNLIQSVASEEVNKSLFDIGDDKALGPDEY